MEKLNMKEIRQKMKLTQEQVAERSGLCKDYISMLERGERNPSDKTKIILADIYKVSVIDIFLAIQRTKSTVQCVAIDKK